MRDVFVPMDCVSRCWIHTFQPVLCSAGFTCSKPLFRVVGFASDTCLCCWIHTCHYLFCAALFTRVTPETLYIRYEDNKETVCYVITQKAIRPSLMSPLLLFSTNLTSLTACIRQRTDFSRNRHYTQFGVTLGIGTVSI